MNRNSTGSNCKFTRSFRWVLVALVVCACQDLQAQETATSVRFDSPVVAICHDPTSGNRFVASGNLIVVLDAANQQIESIDSSMEFVHDLVVSDGQLIAVGGNPGEHGVIEVYSSQSFKLQRKRIVHADSILSVAMGEKYAITASADHECRVVDLVSLDSVYTYSGHSGRVTAIATIAKSKGFVSGGLDDTLRVWSWKKKETVRTLTAHLNDIYSIDVLENETGIPLVVSTSVDKTIRFWQPAIGRMIRFSKQPDQPTVCCWKPATQSAYVGTDKGRLLEIDSQTLKTQLVGNFKSRIYEICPLADAILVGTEGSLKILKLSKPKKQ